MYKKLYRTFYYDTFTYHLFSPKQTVVDYFDELFIVKKGLFKLPNLVGKFVEYPDTFYMTQKWWLGHIKNFEREPAILKGVITQKNENETTIEISVRPNSVFLILFVCFLLFSIYALYKAIITKDLNPTLVGMWPLVFALPLLFLFARAASTNLRKSFEKYLNLSPDKN